MEITFAPLHEQIRILQSEWDTFQICHKHHTLTGYDSHSCPTDRRSFFIHLPNFNPDKKRNSNLPIHSNEWGSHQSAGFHLTTWPGRAIAQAVNRRLPTATARVQNRVRSCGILWWTKVALGQVFSENFGLFPLPIYIPSASPQSSSLSPEAGRIGWEWPQCQ
jgi:hypothetical protein